MGLTLVALVLGLAAVVSMTVMVSLSALRDFAPFLVDFNHYGEGWPEVIFGFVSIATIVAAIAAVIRREFRGHEIDGREN